MKPNLTFCVALCSLALAHPANAQTAPSAGAPSGPIRVTVDSAPVVFAGQQPVQRGSHILVPLRGVFEKMGAQVKYDAAAKMVNAKSDKSTLALTVGSTEAQVDGKTVTLDTPPTLANGSVLVPIRFVSENLGSTIHFDKPTQTVVIDTTKTAAPSSGSIAPADTPAAGTTTPAATDTPAPVVTPAPATPAPQAAPPTVIVNNTTPTPAPTPQAASVPVTSAPVPTAPTATPPAPAPVVVTPAAAETGSALATYLPYIIGALVLLGALAWYLNRRGKTGQVIAADDSKRP